MEITILASSWSFLKLNSEVVEQLKDYEIGKIVKDCSSCNEKSDALKMFMCFGCNKTNSEVSIVFMPHYYLVNLC